MITDSISTFFTTPENLIIILLGLVVLGSIIGIALGVFIFNVFLRNGREHRRVVREFNKTTESIYQSIENHSEKILDNTRAAVANKVYSIALAKSESKSITNIKAIDDKLTNNLMAIDSRLTSIEIAQKELVPKRKYTKRSSKQIEAGRPKEKDIFKKKVSKKVTKKRK